MESLSGPWPPAGRNPSSPFQGPLSRSVWLRCWIPLGNLGKWFWQPCSWLKRFPQCRVRSISPEYYLICPLVPVWLLLYPFLFLHFNIRYPSYLPLTIIIILYIISIIFCYYALAWNVNLEKSKNHPNCTAINLKIPSIMTNCLETF